MTVESALEADFIPEYMPYRPPPKRSLWALAVQDFIALQHGTRLLWAPVCFGLGIGLHVALPWAGQRLAFSLALVLLIGLAALRWRRRSLMLILPLLLCLAGGLRFEQRALAVKAPVLDRPLTLSLAAKVVSAQVRPSGHHRLIVQPLSASRPFPGLKFLRLTILKGHASAQPGDIIDVKARLTPPPGPSLPGGYDRSRRDWFTQIGAQGFVLGELRLLQKTAVPPDRFASARQALSQKMQRAMPGDAGAVAAAMITGDDTPLSLTAERNLQVTSLYHLLSVSGFHLAIITGLVFLIVRHGLALIPRLALDLLLKHIAALAAIVMAIAYTLFTGAAWPTIRACIATVLVMLAILMGRQPFSLRLVAFGALVILAWRPEALVDVSFQFSFAAISGLVAAHQSRLGQWLSRGRGDDSLPAWLLRRLGFVALISLAAETAILPIALLHFHQMGIYGIAANAVAAPLVTYIIMPLGLLTAMLAPMGWDGPIASLLGGACNILLAIADIIARWPAARILAPEYGTLAFVLAMIGFVILLLVRGRMRLCGLAFAAAAVVAAILYPQADIRISSDARQVLLRTDAGSVVISDERGSAMLRKRWREVHGFAPEWSWADGGLGYGITSASPRCGGNGCTAEIRRGRKIWRIAVFGRTATPTRCPAQADILIDGRDLRALYCTAPLYVDRRTMAGQGITALRFSDKKIRLDTDRARRGDRPWVRGPWGDSFDQLAMTE